MIKQLIGFAGTAQPEQLRAGVLRIRENDVNTDRKHMGVLLGDISVLCNYEWAPALLTLPVGKEGSVPFALDRCPFP